MLPSKKFGKKSFQQMKKANSLCLSFTLLKCIRNEFFFHLKVQEKEERKPLTIS